LKTELHIYAPADEWVMGGDLIEGLSLKEALARVRRCARPGAEIWYRTKGTSVARAVPPDDGRDLPDLEVFAADARDRHL
jgi:hypothetical protein